MGFFGNLLSSAFNIGKKLFGLGKTAHAIGKKAVRHYERGQVIGQKVSRAYHHGRHLYDEAKHLKTLEQAADFAKREIPKARDYSRATEKVAREAAQLGRDARRNFRIS